MNAYRNASATIPLRGMIIQLVAACADNHNIVKNQDTGMLNNVHAYVLHYAVQKDISLINGAAIADGDGTTIWPQCKLEWMEIDRLYCLKFIPFNYL